MESRKMDKNKKAVVQGWQRSKVYCGFFMLTWLIVIPSFAQKKQLVQIKTFDQQLTPYRNIEISLNGKGYFAVGNKGVAFVELSEEDFPLKTIAIKDEKLEAASWNYSKGTIEIIIRSKNYHLARVVIHDQNSMPISHAQVTFHGKKSTSGNTNKEGQLEIPVALDEKINSVNQFSVHDFVITKLSSIEDKIILTVDRITPTRKSEEPVISKNSAEYFKDFDLSKLDSIQSLTVFYAIFKNFQISDMSAVARRKIDAKFNQLVLEFQDSVGQNQLKFVGKISDSSYVTDDIKSLLEKAENERKTLEEQRSEFDQNIQIIQEKLESGITNLDETTRANLLSDLTRLEMLLIENEGRFYKNQNDYRSIINSLKEKYFDVTDLENRLSESEAKRLEEQRAFRQKLFITLAVLLVFSVLILLLIYFSDKLKKQKKALVLANGEISRINENLETLVAERTKLLEDAMKELDTFLYRASHDLRSPVCSIIGLCNIALHMSNGESRDLVERVVLTTTNMDKLLKKLSIISEINQPTNFSSITLLDLMENVKENYADTIRDQQIKFTMDCPGDLVIFSYPNLIETILVNLVENAIFYSVMKDPQNAKLELRAAIKNNQVEISLYDNGIGVEEEIRHRLFDMFFKGHENSKGHGLGLYIVQKSVQALEGTIEVESNLGSFTRFVVKLPMKPMALGPELSKVKPMELYQDN